MRDMQLGNSVTGVQDDLGWEVTGGRRPIRRLKKINQLRCGAPIKSEMVFARSQ